jgi:anti-anti-sigma factor
MVAQVTRAPTHYAVSLSGELDLGEAQFLRHEVCALVGAGPATILADLSGVRYFGCSGLNALLSILQAAETRGGFLYVTGMSDAVQRVLDLTGTAKIVADREQALESWPGAPI